MIRVAVPGKVMLAGEYSVLQGGCALAATVARHLVVTVSQGPSARTTEVRSNLWEGPRHVAAAEAAGAAPDAAAAPLLRAVAHGLSRHGLDGLAVRVTSELDLSYGIGSSSALRLAVQVGLSEWALRRQGASAARPHAALWDDARAAFALQEQAQGRASGYDVAVQLLGGLVLYTPPAAGASWPGTAVVLGPREQAALGGLVQVWVGGAGAPTGRVTRDTLAWLDATASWPRLTAAADDLLQAVLAALAQPDEPVRAAALARAVRAHRDVLADSPHAPRQLIAALAALPGEGELWSFKTTGAGGEDALLVFHPAAATAAGATAWLAKQGWQPLAAAFETAGTHVEAQNLGRVGEGG